MRRLVVVGRRVLVRAGRVVLDSASCLRLCCAVYRRAVLCPCESLPKTVPSHLWIRVGQECTGPVAAPVVPEDAPSRLHEDADAPGARTA